MTLTKKESRGQSYALAFGIPVGLMLIVMLIAGSEPFGGDVSMLYSDMYHQYFPFWVEFGRAIREGDGLLWNWAAGMGMDYLSLISYYLASPLNLISAIVPAGWELEIYSLLMPIKLGLASLFFAIFLRNTFQKEDISISLFGSGLGGVDGVAVFIIKRKPPTDGRWFYLLPGQQLQGIHALPVPEDLQMQMGGHADLSGGCGSYRTQNSADLHRISHFYRRLGGEIAVDRLQFSPVIHPDTGAQGGILPDLGHRSSGHAQHPLPQPGGYVHTGMGAPIPHGGVKGQSLNAEIP